MFNKKTAAGINPAAACNWDNQPPCCQWDFAPTSPVQNGTLLVIFTRVNLDLMQLLQPYTLDELCQVVSRAADKLSYLYDNLALDGIAVRSRGTPRVALRLLRRCADAAVASQVV